MIRSAIFELAAQLYRECRDEYDDLLEHAYQLAERETNGALLNRRGQSAGINPRRLFACNEAYATAYASEELREHWERHRRPIYADYERRWLARYNETSERPTDW